jgi:hypothetical protein
MLAHFQRARRFPRNKQQASCNHQMCAEGKNLTHCATSESELHACHTTSPDRGKSQGKPMTLSKRTTENLSARNKPRLVVLALQQDIGQALTDGLMLSEIWRQLHAEGAFPAGYDRFRRLVRRFVTKRSKKPTRSNAPSAVASTGFILSRNLNPKDLV